MKFYSTTKTNNHIQTSQKNIAQNIISQWLRIISAVDNDLNLNITIIAVIIYNNLVEHHYLQKKIMQTI